MPLVQVVQPGRLVVLFEGYGSVHTVRIVAGNIFNCKTGNFRHDDIIGRAIGSKVADRRSGRWIAVLDPSPELVAMSLKHRTQILYHTDISVILSLLDVKPGHVVIESGTGTGTLTLALGRAVAPTGRVMSFEYHSGRLEAAKQLFGDLQLSEIIRLTLRNVVTEGFGVENMNAVLYHPPGSCDALTSNSKALETEEGAAAVGSTTEVAGEGSAVYADAVFLDLPRPFDVVCHATQCLKDGARFVSFSPCVEQIQKTAEQLRKLEYQEIRTLEVLCKPWKSVKFAVATEPRAQQSALGKRRTALSEPTENSEGQRSKRRRTGGGRTRENINREAEKAAQTSTKPTEDTSSNGHDVMDCVTRHTSAEICELPAVDLKKVHHSQMSMRGHTGYLVFATLYRKHE